MSDDMLVYPMEKVVGIAADDDTLDAVGEALSASGVDDGRVEVLSGRDGQRRLDPKGEERGKLATALRTVQKALGEEAVRMEKLNDAIEDGKYVVQVEMPDIDDDDAYEAEKRNIGNAMFDGGATDVAFYGKLAIEELQLGA